MSSPRERRVAVPGRGPVDEMEINLAPTLLGSGERLFDGIDDLHGLELVRTVATEQIVHIKMKRRPR